MRGGIAWFRYQLAVNDVGGPTNLASGVFTAQSPGTQKGYADIDVPGFYTPPASTSASQFVSGSSSGAAISPFAQGDNRTPYVMDYNFTISQALPWRSVFEMSYVGNKSYNELINGGNSNLYNQNNPAPGSYFLPDPVLGINVSTAPPTCNSSTAGDNAVVCATVPNYAIQENSANGGGFDANHFRPLKNYSDIYLITHGSYANYNSLQASWQKQSGPVTFLVELHLQQGAGHPGWANRQRNRQRNRSRSLTAWPNNYGPLAYDHTHILNFSFVWNLPKFIHGNSICWKER